LSGPRGKPLRAFFALWPDDDVRRQLAERAAIAARQCGGRAPKPETLHLTLVFLGSTPMERVAALTAAMDRVDVPSFPLTFDRSGWFRQSGVAWLGVGRIPEPLVELQSSLARSAGRMGFSLDVRPYVPHLTLARDIRKPLPDRVFAPVEWRVSSFALMASELLPDGPRYRIVHETPLRSDTAAGAAVEPALTQGSP